MVENKQTQLHREAYKILAEKSADINAALRAAAYDFGHGLVYFERVARALGVLDVTLKVLDARSVSGRLFTGNDVFEFAWCESTRPARLEEMYARFRSSDMAECGPDVQTLGDLLDEAHSYAGLERLGSDE